MPRAAQHRTGKPELHGALRANHADIDGALLPDAIVREQGLIFIDAGRKAPHEIRDEIQQPARAALVQPVDVLFAAPLRVLILRHDLRQISIHAARTIVGRVHARAGDRLVAIHQIFALAEAIEKHRHGADIEAVRAQPHQMIENARDLVEHHADVLRAQRRLHAQQLFDRHDVGMLVAHHRDVVEPVHVADRLIERLALGELLGAAVQQPDVRVGFLNDLAVHFEHQAQHAVRGRMLRTEVHRVVANLSHWACRGAERCAWSVPDRSDCRDG